MMLDKLILTKSGGMTQTSFRVPMNTYRTFKRAASLVGVTREAFIEVAMRSFIDEVEAHFNKERVPVHKTIQEQVSSAGTP